MLLLLLNRFASGGGTNATATPLGASASALAGVVVATGLAVVSAAALPTGASVTAQSSAVITQGAAQAAGPTTPLRQSKAGNVIATMFVVVEPPIERMASVICDERMAAALAVPRFASVGPDVRVSSVPFNFRTANVAARLR